MVILDSIINCFLVDSCEIGGYVHLIDLWIT